jgi:ubiquinone/menaquinone biosynthesis C-methylase UbiE
MDFHNRRERDRRILAAAEFERKYANKKWYSVGRKSQQYVDDWLARHCPGKIALDYCCGLGGMCLRMAQSGAFVHGIDISDESVHTAQELLDRNGLGSRAQIQVMDAERMTFPDGTFDVIVCSGVLHHLDLDRAYPELARVLKPDGRILCMEAVGHNPLIRLYRKLTPSLRTSWEADHILKRRDVLRSRQHFREVNVRFFHLLSIAAVTLRKTPLFAPALSVLDAMDAAILRLPGLRWMAWQMVFELRGSRAAPQSSCESG